MPPKRPLDASVEPSGRDKKRQKINDARAIRTGPAIASAAPSALKQLPLSLDVKKFTQARAFEINAMQKAMKSVKSAASTRVWQSLPRHLRRRAASHNIRRVPVRLRERARQEMDPVKKKRLKAFIAKAGKLKRKTRTEVLLRRQRDKRWLETHIWHAKRMKMENVWGYRLALHPTEKSFRPSHRAAVNGCILHDSSYMAMIELKGELEILKKAMWRVCNPYGPSAAGTRYSNGSRVCKTEIYKDGSYPLDFISPCHILWQPLLHEKKKGPKGYDKVPYVTWIRVHPAAYEMASQALTNALTTILKQEKEAGNPSVEVEIADLRGQTNSFDLIGPKSSQVLRGALSLAKMEVPQVKKQFWSSVQDLRTPGSCPRGMVIGLRVNDPRLNFPPKNATITEGAGARFNVRPSPELAASGLWAENIRAGLSKPTFKKKDLDARRAKNLIPGTPLAPLPQDDRVPIMLVQQSLEAPISSYGTVKQSDHAMHGWTIITPLGWGMPFLSSLIFTGSRVGGLREVKSQAFESGLPFFPDDFSGTTLGQESQDMAGNEAKSKWERTPPAKRVPFEALGTTSPFQPDWHAVCNIQRVSEPEKGFEGTQRMEVDKEVAKIWLLYGQDTKPTVNELISVDDPAKHLFESINAARMERGLSSLDTEPSRLYRGALVLVRVSMCGRGTPSDMSMVYDMPVNEYATLEDESVPKQHASNDIVGYITTGRQSLRLGKGIGIGAVALSRYVESVRQHREAKLVHPHMLKIREARGEVYRRATVEVI